MAGEEDCTCPKRGRISDAWGAENTKCQVQTSVFRGYNSLPGVSGRGCWCRGYGLENSSTTCSF